MPGGGQRRGPAVHTGATSTSLALQGSLDLLRRHGWNATSFHLLRPACAVWTGDDDAAVAYVDTGSAWVAAGAPVCAVERLGAATERFVADAAARGRRAVFLAVEQRLRDAAPWLRAVRVGRQPVWDPRGWAATAAHDANLRSQIRRPGKKGVVARVIDPAELEGAALGARIESLAAAWKASRAIAPLRFLVDVDVHAVPGERRYVVAERDGAIVGALLAAPVYARGGWYLENVLRAPGAPNGTAELLVDTAMRAIADEGSRWATLGLAPLDGPIPGWLRVARACGRPFYDFDGLARFKARLRPHRWDAIYVAHPPRTCGALALVEAVRALAGAPLAVFAARTLAHWREQRRAPPALPAAG